MVKQAHQSIIELNGQRYNALTGKLIENASKPVDAPDSTQILSIDGVARLPLVRRGKTASKEIHKATQAGKTLMRRAVKKPSSITDRKTVAMDVMPHASNQTTTAVFHSVNSARGHRAEATRQNSLVSRFGGELRDAPDNVQHTPANQAVTETQVVAPASAASVFSVPSQTLANKMLTKGLRSANSHKETTAKKAKLHHRVGRKLGLSAKAASIASGSLAVLIIGGFFVYQNIPNIAVHYASAKAGVHASLPEYQPSGFAVSSRVEYSPGTIAIDYKANADDRTYTVTQKATNMNSETLKEHLTTTSTSTPLSFPESGRTIYLDGNSGANWVDKGVWYSISGDSSLNTDQLIKIATSL